MDTIEGPYDLYDQEDDDDDGDQNGDEDFAQMNDSSDEDPEGDGLEQAKRRANRKKLNQSHDKLEVNLDEVQDEDDQECLLNYNPKPTTDTTKVDDDDDKKSTTSSVVMELFQKKESQDKGLADMETGSEVYMSELLVSIFFLLTDFKGWLRHG